MRRTIGITTVAASLLILGAGPAFAQGYPPQVAPQVLVSDASIDCAADQAITISGEGWVPNGTVQVLWDGEQIGSGSTDGNGDFSISASPPEGSTQGTHTLTGRQGSRTATATVNCVTGAVGAAGAGVAFTGANITVGLLILVGLLLAGAATLWLGRRRRTA